MKKETKFYMCTQNNSGGYFIKDNNVAEFVCVEARNQKQAYKKFQKILKNYREYCPCCGERWNDYCLLWKHDDYGSDTPTIFGYNYKEIKDEWYKNDEIIIYYADGTKEKYALKNNWD